MSEPLYNEKPKSLCEKVRNDYVLVLHNDDYNTFDFVIEKLVSICNHTESQALQCAIITHYKGMCEVLLGDLLKLNSICRELSSVGLKVSVENNF